jgi:UDP-3-O-[3-hydroxymyristoyl] glucosamine N-acyltransferase
VALGASPLEDETGRGARLVLTMKKPTQHSVDDLAQLCGAGVRGDGSVLVHGVASIESAKQGDLVFASDSTKLQSALLSQASAVIAGDFATQELSKPLLIAHDPKIAFARVAELFSKKDRKTGVDPRANVHPSAKLGKDVWIGPGAVIEEGVQVGDRTSVAANAVIGVGVSMGRDCEIGPNVTVYSGSELCNRVRVQAGSVIGSAGFGYVRDEQSHYRLFPQIGRVLLEDDVDVGANCTIDRGALDATVIRRGTKLDNMVHVGHNVEIGEDVVIAAQTGISGSSRIGSGAIVGGQVGIADHVRVEDGVILGAQSGVPSNKVVRGKGIVFWGTPARPIREYLKELAVLARLARKKGP